MTITLSRKHGPQSLPSLALALGIVAASTGCATTSPCGGPATNFGAVTLCPGVSQTCVGRPCSVYFRMPPGSGRYALHQYTVGRIGEYPAGQTVSLGGYWESTTFSVPDAGVPDAYLYILAEP